MKRIETKILLAGALGLPFSVYAADCPPKTPANECAKNAKPAPAPAPAAPARPAQPQPQQFQQQMPQAQPGQRPPVAGAPNQFQNQTPNFNAGGTPRTQYNQPGQPNQPTNAPQNGAFNANNGNNGNNGGPGAFAPNRNAAQSPAQFQPQSQSQNNGFAQRPAPAPDMPARPAAAPVHQAYSVAPAAVSAKRPNGDAVLNNNGSATVLRQLNTNRASMGNLNSRPIPSGAITSHANGSVTVQASGNRQYDLRPDGRLASYSGQGAKAEFRPNGQVGTLHTNNLDMMRGVHGEKTVVIRGPNNSVVVSNGPGFGYVQRNATINGRPYYQRTYIVGGVPQTRLYTYSTYHGVEVQYYVPTYRYAPAYYGWVYYPWRTPVRYEWGWQAAPWYGAYGGYYAPAPYYPTPSLWLTDYYLSQTMSNAYQVQQANAQAPGYIEAPPVPPDQGGNYSDTYSQADTPITPALKQELSEQVHQQVSLENAAAQNPQNAADLYSLDKVLVPNHLFVSDQSLNVNTSDQQTCSLAAGNVLRLLATPDDTALNATLVVAASRQADCPAGQQVIVSIAALQEMHNSFRAQLDAGMVALRGNQGQGGLPKAPASAIAPPPQPQEDLPQSDADALTQLSTAQQQADQEETQVKAAAFNDNKGS